MDPEEAIDRIAAGQGAPPGHRVLHAKGDFYSGTFNASPEATALCRARAPAGRDRARSWSAGRTAAGGPTRATTCRSSAGCRSPSCSRTARRPTCSARRSRASRSARPRTSCASPRSTRDRRELAKFLATRPRTALALAANARARALAPPQSYAEATYFPVHAYRWLTWPATGPGCGTGSRRGPDRGPRRPVHRPRAAARGDPGPARAGPGGLRPGRHRRRRRRTTRTTRCRCGGGAASSWPGGSRSPRPRTTTRREGDLVVFDPTRVVDGIELSATTRSCGTGRPPTRSPSSAARHHP